MIFKCKKLAFPALIDSGVSILRAFVILLFVLFCFGQSIQAQESPRSRDLSFQAYQFLQSEDYDSALIAYKKLIKTNPTNSEFYNNISYIYLLKKKYNKAEFYADRAVEIKPQFSDAWINLGTAYYHQQIYSGAVKAFKQALKYGSLDNTVIDALALAKKELIKQKSNAHILPSSSPEIEVKPTPMPLTESLDKVKKVDSLKENPQLEEQVIKISGSIRKLMDTYHIPGLALFIIKDGQAIYQAGFGRANMEKNYVVHAAETKFALGEVTQLLTATAILQLVEKGDINLEESVRAYLPQLRHRLSADIKVSHLLSHSSGLEEKLMGSLSPVPLKPITFTQFFLKHRPNPLNKPKVAPNHLNYGYGLLGQIIEKVTNLTYHQYIQKNIFDPLSMKNSHFFMEPEQAELLAENYAYQRGSFYPQPLIYSTILSSQGAYTTVGDFSKFIYAHLNQQLLKPELLNLLFKPQTEQSELLGGWSFGLAIKNSPSLKNIAYLNGELGLFRTQIILQPEQGFGVFVALNGGGNAIFNREDPSFFSREILSILFPNESIPVIDSKSISKKMLQKYTGYYRPSKYGGVSPEKLLSIFSIYQIAAQNQELTLSPLFSGEIPTRWVPYKTDVFKQVSLQGGYLAFQVDSSQQVTTMQKTLWQGMGSFVKIVWYETPPFQIGLIAICSAIFILSNLLWFLLIFAQKKAVKRSILSRVARWIASIINLLNLSFIIGLFILLRWFKNLLLYENLGVLQYLFYLPVVTLVFIFPLVMFNLLAFKNKYWNFVSRLHYMLITMASFAYLWFVNHWNLFPFYF